MKFQTYLYRKMESLEQQRISDSLNQLNLGKEESKTPLLNTIPIILLPVGIAGMSKQRLYEAARTYALDKNMTCDYINYKEIRNKYIEKVVKKYPEDVNAAAGNYESHIYQMQSQKIQDKFLEAIHDSVSRNPENHIVFIRRNIVANSVKNACHSIQGCLNGRTAYFIGLGPLCPQPIALNKK